MAAQTPLNHSFYKQNHGKLVQGKLIADAPASWHRDYGLVALCTVQCNDVG